MVSRTTSAATARCASVARSRPDEIALVERGIERNLAEPSERALVASRPDDPGRFFEDFCNWDRIPEFEEFIRTSPAAAIAGELMGSTQVRLFHDHLLVKEPGTKQKTPWHQDQPYYNVEGFQNCLDVDAGRSGRPRVDGRVRRRLAPRPLADAAHVHGRPGEVVPGGSLEELPDIEADRDAFEILAWELEPGDAVFFHMLTLHAAGGRPAGGGPSRCASSATTQRMRRARGGPRRSSRARRRAACRGADGQPSVPGSLDNAPDARYVESVGEWTRWAPRPSSPRGDHD